MEEFSLPPRFRPLSLRGEDRSWSQLEERKNERCPACAAACVYAVSTAEIDAMLAFECASSGVGWKCVCLRVIVALVLFSPIGRNIVGLFRAMKTLLLSSRVASSTDALRMQYRIPKCSILV